jgi:hypothetical protein
MELIEKLRTSSTPSGECMIECRDSNARIMRHRDERIPGAQTRTHDPKAQILTRKY